MFQFVSWNQQKNIWFVSVWCLEPILKQPKQTELFGNKPKQPLMFWKIPKYALYQTVSVGLLFVLVQSKHRNSLFRHRSETTETNCFETNQNKPKQTGKTLNSLKKYQNKLSIKLFRLFFYLFRFNQNGETLCSGIEAKQPKQRFLFRIVQWLGRFQSKLWVKRQIGESRAWIENENR